MGKKRFFEPWIPLKIILLSLAFLCMSAMAGEPGVTFLFTNGQKASFTFASSPKIAVGSDGINLSSSTAPSVSYTPNSSSLYQVILDGVVVEDGMGSSETITISGGTTR